MARERSLESIFNTKVRIDQKSDGRGSDDHRILLPRGTLRHFGSYRHHCGVTSSRRGGVLSLSKDGGVRNTVIQDGGVQSPTILERQDLHTTFVPPSGRRGCPSASLNQSTASPCSWWRRGFCFCVIRFYKLQPLRVRALARLVGDDVAHVAGLERRIQRHRLIVYLGAHAGSARRPCGWHRQSPRAWSRRANQSHRLRE